MILKKGRKSYSTVMCKKRTTKLSWQTPVFPGAFPVSLQVFVAFVTVFALAHQRVTQRKTQFMAGTKQFPTVTLLVQSCISSKKTGKEKLNKMPIPGAWLWKESRYGPVHLNVPDLYLLMCKEFPHSIVATRVRVYSMFFSQIREKLDI